MGPTERCPSTFCLSLQQRPESLVIFISWGHFVEQKELFKSFEIFDQKALERRNSSNAAVEKENRIA